MNEPAPQDKPNIIGWGIFVILVAAIIYYAVNIMNNPSTARINVITFEYVVDDDICYSLMRNNGRLISHTVVECDCLTVTEKDSVAPTTY